MRIQPRLFVVFLTAAVASGSAACRGSSAPAPAPAAASPQFDQWAETLASDWVRQSPQMTTRTQYLSAEEQERAAGQLSMIGEWDYPFGAAAFLQRSDLAKKGIAALDAMDLNTLTPDQRTSAAVIRWTLEDTAAAAQFARHRYIFDQFNGLQLELINNLTQTHPFKTKRDVDTYLARLGQVSMRLDDGISEARGAAAEGIIPPKIVLQRSIEQIDGFLKTPVAQNVFVATLGTKMTSIDVPLNATAGDGKTALAAAEQVVTDSIIPAYTRVRTMLTEQMALASDDVGVWRLPRGAEYYATQLATFTNSRMTPDDVHNVGLREVGRLEGEMDVILRQLGYTQGTVNERYAKLEADRQPKGPGDPRPQIIADYTKWVRDAEQRAAQVFDLRPKAPVDVRREPAFSEKTAAAHYTDPAPDGSRPGVFFIPLPGPSFALLRMRSLSYHEAVPGHHFQLALQQEMPSLPRYRRLGVFGQTSANIEGWALYAERLADENNWYDGDPHGRLGYLNSMLFRARRLVVDTGIHSKRWTRQQAIDYGINAQEVERYIAWPGQATSYMVGQLRIVDMREKARAALGPKFNVKEFHNVVLRSGSVPLAVLEQQIDAWVKSQS